MRKFLLATLAFLMLSIPSPSQSATLYERIQRSIFLVITPNPDKGPDDVWIGTAFCAPGKTQMLITASHAIGKGSWVKDYAGKDYAVTVMANDEDRDVASLLVADSAPCELSPLEYAKHNAAPLDEAYLFGYGGSMEVPIGTKGVISSVAGFAKNRPNVQMAQLNALHGHSGSPVFDKDGRVVAMLVGGFPDAAGDEMDVVVPVEVIRKVVK